MFMAFSAAAATLASLSLAAAPAPRDAASPWSGNSGKFKDLPNADKVAELQSALMEMRRGGAIRDLTWTPSALTFRRGEGFYSVDLNTGIVTSMPTPEAAAPPAATKPARPVDPPAGRARQRVQATSPDGTLRAVHRDGGVYLETVETKQQKPVIEMKPGENIRYGTADWVYGEELDQGDAMWWSPDGKFLAFYAFDDSQVPRYELLRGWDQLRTSKATMWYPKAGDPNPVAGLMVFEPASGRIVTVDVGPEREQYIYGIQWAPAGKLLYLRTNRRQDTLELMQADPTTGASQAIVTETQPTWQENRPLMRLLADGDRFIWGSERSGFRNLELRKLSDPAFVRSLTRHAFPVLDVVDVDENAGDVWYRANSAAVPMLAQIHRVRLDGTGEQQLTDGRSHCSSPQRSPDGKSMTVVQETPVSPPRTVLLKLDTNAPAQEIATLAAADATALSGLGVPPTELFTFTAADGVTPIWGELFFPPHFDPAKRYPLLVDVYGGPSSQAITGRFDPGTADRALGVLVARIDNRGTQGRGKAFESATYLKLCGPDLDDQAAGVKALSLRPYVDASRVAIKGHSYGGTMSAMAVLRYPDVFKAAVAGAPVTDWRNYDSIYTERYMHAADGEDPGGRRGALRDADLSRLRSWHPLAGLPRQGVVVPGGAAGIARRRGGEVEVGARAARPAEARGGEDGLRSRRLCAGLPAMTRKAPADRGHVRTEHHHAEGVALDACEPGELIAHLARDHESVTRAVLAAAGELGAFVQRLVPRLRRGGRLIYIGAGTSGRLGVLDASECPPTFRSDPAQVVGVIAGGDASLRRSSEGREDEELGAREQLDALGLTGADTLLGIAAGGTTPYVLGAIRMAKARGAATALLTCAPREIPADCDQMIVLDTGPELLAGSTRLKAGSATKLALNAITTAAFAQLGKVYGQVMVDVAATNDKLLDRAARILTHLAPQVGRERALELLHLADGQLPVAIVMAKLGVDASEARRRLDDARGSLRSVIG